MQLSAQLTEQIHREGKARAVFALAMGASLGIATTAVLKNDIVVFLIGLGATVLAGIGWALAYRKFDQLMKHALYEQKVKYRYPADLRDHCSIMTGESARAGLTMAVRALRPEVCRTTALIILSPEANLALHHDLEMRQATNGDYCSPDHRSLVFYGIPVVVDDLCPVYGLLVPEYTGVWLPKDGCILVAEPMKVVHMEVHLPDTIEKFNIKIGKKGIEP